MDNLKTCALGYYHNTVMAIHWAHDVSKSDVNMTCKWTSGHEAMMKVAERACCIEIIGV